MVATPFCRHPEPEARSKDKSNLSADSNSLGHSGGGRLNHSITKGAPEPQLPNSLFFVTLRPRTDGRTDLPSGDSARVCSAVVDRVTPAHVIVVVLVLSIAHGPVTVGAHSKPRVRVRVRARVRVRVRVRVRIRVKR